MLITDGRHADVNFINDWKEDASKKRFYNKCDIFRYLKGKIFDPLNGVQDLKQGHIRFIGDSSQRIEEDYLRILRYLRFFSQYSKKEHDPKQLKQLK